MKNLYQFAIFFFFNFCVFINALVQDDLCTSMQLVDSRNDSFMTRAIKALPNQICSNVDDYTCCDVVMEKQLSEQSIMKLQNKIQSNSNQISNVFSEMHQQFDDYFLNLIKRSRSSLHEMFVDTYGSLYTDNSVVFTKMFEELEVYYRKASTDINDLFDSFFTTLMQRMFQIIHYNRTLSDEYLQCMADNMDTLKPFGDFPSKISFQIQQSFGAAHSLVRALEVAKSINISKFNPSMHCEINLLRMTSCTSCQGLPPRKPCHRECRRVIDGCLFDFSQFMETWDRFIDAMRSAVLRLKGIRSIKSVVQSLDIQMSDAVMTLQNNRVDASAKVFRACGTPSLNLDATPNSGIFSPEDSDNTFTKKDLNGEELDDHLKRNKRSSKKKMSHPWKRRFEHSRKPGTKMNSKINKVYQDKLVRPRLARKRYDLPTPSDLTPLINNVSAILDNHRGVWHNFARVWCNEEADDSATCWNGEEDEKHDYSLTYDDETTQNNHVIRNTSMQIHVTNLKNMIGLLNSNYIMENSDDEDEGFSSSGDGSGEGSAQIPNELLESTTVSRRKCETCGVGDLQSNNFMVYVTICIFLFLRN